MAARADLEDIVYEPRGHGIVRPNEGWELLETMLYQDPMEVEYKNISEGTGLFQTQRETLKRKRHATKSSPYYFHGAHMKRKRGPMCLRQCLETRHINVLQCHHLC